MKHWKTLLDPGQFLGPQDFPAPREVTISRVERLKLETRDGKDEQHPVLFLVGSDGKEYPRCLRLPKLVLKGLSLQLGADIETWQGQKITIYATKCNSFGEVEECLRVQFSNEILGKLKAYAKKRKVSFSVFEVGQ